ncbi:MAG: LCP family protein [Gemmiger sp.]
MSEPRKLNVRSARSGVSGTTAQTAPAAGQTQARPATRQINTQSGRRLNTGSAQQSAAPKTSRQAAQRVSAPGAVAGEDAARAAARQRLEQQRSVSYQGYEQQAAARRTETQELDLNAVRSSRKVYDVNDDAEFEAYQRQRAARRSTAQAAADALSLNVQPEQGRRAPAQAAGRQSSAPRGSGAKHGAPDGGKSGGSGSGGGAKPPRGGKGSTGGGKGKKGKKKKKAKWWQVLLCTLLVLALIFGGTYALIMNALRPATGGNLTLNQLINTPKEYAGKEFNVLLVGVDRSSETAGSEREVNDGMTDMIMWLHFNNETGELKMLQIPRNIFVTTDASFSGNYQINAIAKTQGASGYNDIGALCEYVANAFQVSIDGYVSIRLEKLTELVDIIGGVQMYVPQVMDYGGSHLDPGYQTLNGAACEFFLRTRHIYADSDLGRLNMQRYFYAAMFAKLRSMSIWDIAKNLPFYLSMVETDMNISDLISVALSLKNVDSSKIMLAQVPVYMGGLTYPEGGNSVVVVARQQTADLLNTYYRENTGPVDASQLNVRDDVHNLSGLTASDPKVQFMGTLNAEIADAQANNNIDGSATTDVYDVAESEPETESGAESPAA